MTVICNCGQSFANSGFRQHQRTSDNPLCRHPPPPIVCDDTEDIFNGNLGQPHVEFNSTTDELFIFNPNSDYFGDYGFSSEDESMAETEDVPDDSAEWDSPQPSMDEEQGLEAERKRHESVPMSLEVEGGSVPMRLRGGAEHGLQNQPFIVKYPNPQAGKASPTQGCDMNTEYTMHVSDQDNPYSPFKSKIDWEIAHWAKTRGPSSTAFTELMQIENVSHRFRHSLSGLADELCDSYLKSLEFPSRIQRNLTT